MRLNAITKASLLLLTVNFSCLYTPISAATVLPATNMGVLTSFNIAVAADNDGNAVTVYEQNTFQDQPIASSYSANTLVWEPEVIISDNLTTKLNPDVAMDATSTALAVWDGYNINDFSGTIEANHMPGGGIWEIPVILEGPVAQPGASFPSVGMDGSGNGVAAWTNRLLGEIHASFYNAGTGIWAPFTTIGTPNGFLVKAAYSANGNAAVTWKDTGTTVYAVTSIGLVWQPQTLLDATATTDPDIGMDANGNAIAIWAGNGVGDILWSRFNGVTWSVAQTLSLASGNGQPKIAVTSTGSAVAVWSDGTNIIISRFNGTTWSVPTPIALGTAPSISMDSLGNAIIGWTSPANELFTTRLLFNGVAEAPVFVSTVINTIDSVDVALSSATQVGVIGWADAAGEGSDTFATFILFPALAPTPPTGITGRVCNNSFAMQSDRVHIISWGPSTDPTTVSYYIYRNGVLISIVPASGPFTFYDHNRTKGSPDIYTVYAVNSEGTLSTPVSITLD